MADPGDPGLCSLQPHLDWRGPLDTEIRVRAGRGSPYKGRSHGGDRGSDVLSTGQSLVEQNAAIPNDSTKNVLTQENP